MDNFNANNNTAYSSAQSSPAGNADNAQNTAQTAKDISRVRCFLTGCLIYAAFYTFCLYKNPSGITYPFLVLATIICFRLFVKKRFDDAAGFFKRSCRFYEVSCMLLGISICMTDCPPVIILNKCVIFILMLFYFTDVLFDTSNWHFTQHISSALGVIFGSMGCLMNSFSDYKWYKNASAYLKNWGIDASDTSAPGFLKRNRAMIKSIVLGLMIAFPLLAVTITLLSSADVLFEQMFNKIFSFIFAFDFHLDDWISSLLSNLFGIALMVLIVFIVSYAVLSFLGRRSVTVSPVKDGTFEPVTAITFMGLLAVVYVLFSFIQIFGLFLGNLALPENYTYAGYARQGFFQLLFVCMLNIVLVLACIYFFKKSNALKAVLTIISACTYIMTASSAMRMIMYIQAYNLTFLRIAVLWGLAVIALIMSGVLVYIYNKNFKLFRYCLICTTVLYIAFSFSHPDYITARYNFEHFDYKKASKNISYILELSDDAAPVTLSSDFKELCVSTGRMKTYEYYMDIEPSPITARNFNLSRFIAHCMRQHIVN